MKLGICTVAENMMKVAELGFDYIEVGVGSVAALSQGSFEKLAEAVSGKSIEVEAANGMLPGTFHITGEEANKKEVIAYLEGVFPRLRQLGCKVVVFGSGTARKVPDGFSYKKAWQQMKETGALIADVACKNGITVALEPLNRMETNIINSVAEGGKMTVEVGHPSFKLLADYYHIGKEKEGMGGVMEYGSYIHHVHIAHPQTREVPKAGDKGDYETFFQALKAIGYEGRVSFEGKINDFEGELSVMVSYLKSMMQ